VALFLSLTALILIVSVLFWGAWMYDKSFEYDIEPVTELEDRVASIKRRIKRFFAEHPEFGRF